MAHSPPKLGGVARSAGVVCSKSRSSLFLPERPEIQITVMTPQKIHEALIVAVRNPEQRKHFFVTAPGTLETLADHRLDLVPRDQPLRIRPCDRVPEISHDHLLD